MDGERRRCRRKLAARRWSRQGGGRRRVATAGCCVSEEAQQELAAHLAAPLPSPAGRSGREAKQGKMGVETEGHDHHAGAADGEDKGGGDPHALSSLTHETETLLSMCPAARVAASEAMERSNGWEHGVLDRSGLIRYEPKRKASGTPHLGGKRWNK
ncbi:uncharacterized protein [Lolium perenne]|uniref:uncharacterized protein isoform X1 n=1 Tax=Lolium perenne TaxID=4522 RepID=UPI003A98D9FA